MKKRNLCIVLICCLTMLQFPCQADDCLASFDVSATSDTIELNESVYLLVDLKDNSGFGAMQFCIEYDADKLTLESVSVGEIVPIGAIASVNTDIVGEINFCGSLKK